VPPAEPALLNGFRKVINVSTGYFHAVPHDNEVIVGLLLDGIEDAELEVLDDFENVEGGEYGRVRVEVETSDSGRRESAWAYVAA
jgi:gamma-glutamylcyclotransferase (GGCT)/AIG2-like uncharacterized protein YtfP